MKKTLLLIVLLMACTCLVLVACDGNKQDNDPADTSTQTAAPSETEPETESKTATETDPETESKTESETEPHVHAFGDWIIIKDATCTENGGKERACACGEKETQSIDKFGHTDIDSDTVCDVCDAHSWAPGLYDADGNQLASWAPGLYDADGNQLASWDELVSLYGMDVSYAFDDHHYMYDPSHPQYIFSNNQELIEGTVLVIGEVTNIGRLALAGCDNLTSVTVPDGVTTIGYYAFKNCSNLTNISIPDSAIRFGEDAFKGCAGLKYNEYCDIKYLGNEGNPYVALIEPIDKMQESYIIHENTLTIAYEAFDACEAFTSIEVPDHVRSIDAYAFYTCEALTSVTLPDSLINIGECAFTHCENLTKINIPDNVISIGDYAFSECYGLKNISIPNSLQNLGDTALPISNDWEFNVYDGIRYIGNDDNPYMVLIRPTDYEQETYIIHENTKFIYGGLFCGAFRDCVNVTNINIPQGLRGIGQRAFQNCSNLISINIPSSVATIGFMTFEKCTHLSKVTIDDGVTNISQGAFGGCSGLTNLTLPDSVVSIGSSAFQDCTGLTEVILPNSVVSVGGDAFEGCTGLTSITLSSSMMRIDYSTFEGCTNLNSVTIPESVIRIDNGAFRGCTKLSSIIVPDNVRIIEKSAFAGCSGLTSITIPFVGTSKNCIVNTHFGYIFGAENYEKHGCIPDSLKTVVITGGDRLDDYAFYRCENLEQIIIPDDITSIGTKVFVACNSLKYNLYNNLKYVGSDNNPYMVLVAPIDDDQSSYTIHENTKFLHSQAFWRCWLVTGVTIPNSVINIGDSAFKNCEYLKDVYYIGAENEWANIQIDQGNSYLTNATIYYNWNESES